MTTCEKQFVQILRAAVSNEEISAEIDWPGIWELAQRHHLEVIVSEIAKKDTELSDELRTQMRCASVKMIARDVQQGHCLQQIENALKKRDIPYALLKGAILKNDYQYTHYRFMSDLDFYIRVEDRSAIRKAIESIGGKFHCTESGDEQFLIWNKFGVEFHGRLLYRRTNFGIENYPDWSFVDELHNRLTEEGYALNLLGHAVHDLAGSGPGIRYILDLWIYKNRHQPQPDWEQVELRLRADGIYEVAHNLMDLSEYLFGNGEETPLMIEMADYVIQGGLHGDYRRGLASQAANGNALWKQLFRNRVEFENRYPWLKRYPFLLPVAWIMRLFQSFRRHKRAIKNWRMGVNTISSDEAEMQRQVMARFGL